MTAMEDRNAAAEDIQIDPGALQIPIPVFSIQPLVENAIKHGVARRSERGHVRISITHTTGELRISVENSGSGAPARSTGTGVGLQNVRRRLEICYGSGAGLQLTFHPESTVAELAIPVG